MSGIITDCDREWMQEGTASLLLDTCTLRNPGVQSRGAGGGVVDSTPIDTENVPCLRVIDSSLFRGSGISDIAERLEIVIPYFFQFAYGQTGLSESTTVIQGGEVFKVKAVIEGGALSVDKIAVCVQIGFE